MKRHETAKRNNRKDKKENYDAFISIIFGACRCWHVPGGTAGARTTCGLIRSSPTMGSLVCSARLVRQLVLRTTRRYAGLQANRLPRASTIPSLASLAEDARYTMVKELYRSDPHTKTMPAGGFPRNHLLAHAC